MRSIVILTAYQLLLSLSFRDFFFPWILERPSRISLLEFLKNSLTLITLDEANVMHKITPSTFANEFTCDFSKRHTTTIYVLREN